MASAEQTKNSASDRHVALVDQYSAHNYSPLPVVVATAKGVWITDVEGRRYMDFLSAYSAVNFGHVHPELTAVAKAQLDKVTLTSRAFYSDTLGPFCEAVAKLTGKESVLPMNSGAEAVETAVKVARKWGYKKKGVPDNQATIITCAGNFHGRTTTIVSFSDDPQSRGDFGPHTPGFVSIPYGDIGALERAIDKNTVAFLVEPIQGEAGIIVPPEGYLKAVREVCSKHNVLYLGDEIQAGLGRTGKTFANDHENVTPDIYILGKALGGGIMPVSAIAADRAIMDVLKPGDHGSTFGGNPLACAIGVAVCDMLAKGTVQANSAKLGEYMLGRLRALKSPRIKTVRGRGLWAGIELNEKARPFCERLMHDGVLCKDTHGTTIRLAPPLVITREELDWALERIEKVLA
ncbi:MAG: ornithine--oxo-acid transaminase [Myxococcota bacterium]